METFTIPKKKLDDHHTVYLRRTVYSQRTVYLHRTVHLLCQVTKVISGREEYMIYPPKRVLVKTMRWCWRASWEQVTAVISLSMISHSLSAALDPTKKSLDILKLLLFHLLVSVSAVLLTEAMIAQWLEHLGQINMS